MTTKSPPKRWVRRWAQRVRRRISARAYVEAFAAALRRDASRPAATLKDDGAWLWFPPALALVCLLGVSGVFWLDRQVFPGLADTAAAEGFVASLWLISVAVTVSLVALIILLVTAPGFLLLGAGLYYLQSLRHYEAAHVDHEQKIRTRIEEHDRTVDAAAASVDPNTIDERHGPSTDNAVRVLEKAKAAAGESAALARKLDDFKRHQRSGESIATIEERGLKELRGKFHRLVVFGLVANLCAVLMFATWAQLTPAAFEGAPPGTWRFTLYIVDLVLRGVFIHVVEMLEIPITDVALNRSGDWVFFISVLSFRVLESFYITAILLAYLKLRFLTRATRRAKRKDAAP